MAVAQVRGDLSEAGLARAVRALVLTVAAELGRHYYRTLESSPRLLAQELADLAERT